MLPNRFLQCTILYIQYFNAVITLVIFHSLQNLQARKYVKRSELERVSLCKKPDPELPHRTPEKEEGSMGGATLMSPTAITSIGGSALFSIPKLEV